MGGPPHLQQMPPMATPLYPTGAGGCMPVAGMSGGSVPCQNLNMIG